MFLHSLLVLGCGEYVKREEAKRLEIQQVSDIRIGLRHDVEERRDCEQLCDTNTDCTAFQWRERGKKCELLRYWCLTCDIKLQKLFALVLYERRRHTVYCRRGRM